MPLIVYELYLPPTRAAASTLEAALEAEPKGTFLAWSPGFGYPHWGSPYLQPAGRAHIRALWRPVCCLRETRESRRSLSID